MCTCVVTNETIFKQIQISHTTYTIPKLLEIAA